MVRRTRLADTTQARLFPLWRHHAFITNRDDLTAVEADAFHRHHAVVELAIRDLKAGGAEHIPSGHYPANAAWFAWMGLRRLGYADEADDMRDRLAAIVLREGLREYYDARTGAGMGAMGLPGSGTMAGIGEPSGNSPSGSALTFFSAILE